VPNPNIETPNYSIKRVRDDEVGLPENAVISYQMAEQAPEEIDFKTAAEKQPAAQGPAVQTIVPAAPAPTPTPPTPQAAPPAAEGPGLLARLFGWLRPKPAAEPAPAEPTRPERGGRERGDRRRRGERGDRGPRGDRTSRGERPSRGERGERTDRGERGERAERGEGRRASSERRRPRSRSEDRGEGDGEGRRTRQSRGGREATKSETAAPSTDQPAPDKVEVAGTGAQPDAATGEEAQRKRRRRRRGRGSRDRKALAAAGATDGTTSDGNSSDEAVSAPRVDSERAHDHGAGPSAEQQEAVRTEPTADVTTGTAAEVPAFDTSDTQPLPVLQQTEVEIPGPDTSTRAAEASEEPTAAAPSSAPALPPIVAPVTEPARTEAYELPVRPEATPDPIADAQLSPSEVEAEVEAVTGIEFVDTLVEEEPAPKQAAVATSADKTEPEVEEPGKQPAGRMSAPVEAPRASRDEPVATAAESAVRDEQSETANAGPPDVPAIEDGSREGVEGAGAQPAEPPQPSRPTYTVWSSTPSGSHHFGPKDDR